MKMTLDELPFLTADAPAVEVRIRERHADFKVDEIPAYEACGAGDHVLFRVRKCGLPTPRALAEIARALGVRAWEVGCAGLKDAHAEATQYLSVEHRSVEEVLALDLPGLQVLSAERHRNKLRRGHLAGNRFAIRLRGVEGGRAGQIGEVLNALEHSGAPNYFGPQRFGYRGDGGLVGEAILRRDWSRAVELLAGSPGPHDSGPVLEAREHFVAGRYVEAATRWPRSYEDSARVTRAMEQSGGDPERAVAALDRRARTFFVTAWQSALFNRVLAQRLAEPELGIDRVHPGDLAWKHAGGAVFRVEDAGAEAQRALEFEISPSGPLLGKKCLVATGIPGEVERRVLEEFLDDAELLERGAQLGCRGARRALRVRPTETAVETGSDHWGTFIEVRFVLPPGCFATTVLREITKTELR